MSQADDFVRAQSTSTMALSQSGGHPPGRSSISGMHSSMNRSSFKLQQKKDPYNLDFTQLRKEYVDETTI